MTREQRIVKKISIDEKKEINKAFNKLKYLVAEKGCYGTAFEYTYNYASIKHGIFGKGFHSFKAWEKTTSRYIYYKFERTSKRYYGL